MKELRQSVVQVAHPLDQTRVLDEIEAEVKKYWEEGWVFVRAEPDRLLSSVCIFFEREVHV